MTKPTLKEMEALVDPALSLIRNTQIGEGVKIMPFTNIWDSNLGDGVFIDLFCNIGGTVIGKNTRIGSGTFLCPGVNIGEECFIGHGVKTTNDSFSDVPEYETIQEWKKEWRMLSTIIGDKVRIGSGAVLLPVKIGERAIIGAGCIVTKDVAPGDIVAGNPARVIGNVDATKF